MAIRGRQQAPAQRARQAQISLRANLRLVAVPQLYLATLSPRPPAIGPHVDMPIRALLSQCARSMWKLHRESKASSSACASSGCKEAYAARISCQGPWQPAFGNRRSWKLAVRRKTEVRRGGGHAHLQGLTAAVQHVTATLTALIPHRPGSLLPTSWDKLTCIPHESYHYASPGRECRAAINASLRCRPRRVI
jgi:hypothetical protein